VFERITENSRGGHVRHKSALLYQGEPRNRSANDALIDSSRASATRKRRVEDIVANAVPGFYLAPNEDLKIKQR